MSCAGCLWCTRHLLPSPDPLWDASVTKDGQTGKGGSCEYKIPGSPERISGICPSPKAPSSDLF